MFYSFHWQIKQRNYQLEQYFVQSPLEGLVRGFASLFREANPLRFALVGGSDSLLKLVACKAPARNAGVSIPA